MTDALVIGAGPAGLMAAEMLADGGHSVLVAEAKPTVGCKLLMAGKSGLNLTKDEPFANFLSAYGEAEDWLTASFSAYNNTSVCRWVEELGQVVFTGSSGRVFPKTMKASPLLRSWLQRLNGKGVKFAPRWRWTGWQSEACAFDTPGGAQSILARVTVLALGGASWARLGSDGDWADILNSQGVILAPFQPSNMGIILDWSSYMARFYGDPVKNVILTCDEETRPGEFVVSKSGLEGSGIYSFSRDFRQGIPLTLDLLPNLSRDQIDERLARVPSKNTLSNALRKALKLSPVKIALLQEFAKPPQPRGALAGHLKSLPVPYTGVAPLDKAISVAGGVTQNALTDDFMLKVKPGTFCAGEMLDWEAPTGGYLLTGCLATGRSAGLAAVEYLRNQV